MLSVSKLTESARECLGWPYVSPGTNDRNGIDCSGLFVKMYRDQGAKIYHGSNTIFREYCEETGKLTSVDQLQIGMAVFKRKDWTDTDKSNRWYGTDPGNLSHIGYVESVHPLRIIHASTGTMCVTTDDKIGKWAYWGKLKDVDYSGTPSPEPSPDPEPITVTKMVFAENGKPVNLRYGPSLDKKIMDEIPAGETVTLSQIKGSWSKVSWRKKTGWMMNAFLVDPDTPVPDPDPEPTPDPDPPVLIEDATVWSDNGKPVKMREKPSQSCRLYDDIPVETVVAVDAYNACTDAKGNRWSKVSYGIRKGWYIMTKFLSVG